MDANHHRGEEPAVVFMLPGGGAQYAGMGRELYEEEPVYRAVIDAFAAALAAVGYTAGPAAAGTTRAAHRARLTVLGTTDLHGNVFNWDYFKNAEFTKAAADDIGVAKVATLIEALKRQHRGEPVITIDAGDTIQGTPLAYYYARIAPITERRHPPDGGRDEPLRLRRRRARQPRVQLRHRAPAHLRVAAELPAARRQRGRPGHQAAGVPAVRHQGAAAPATAARSRSASSA